MQSTKRRPGGKETPHRPFPHEARPSPANAIETLTPKERAHLRALAHPLKPVLHVGKEGVTDAAVQALQAAFNTRELAKVKVLETAPESARDTAESLAARVEHAQVVQVMGRTAVLYRPLPKKAEAPAAGAAEKARRPEGQKAGGAEGKKARGPAGPKERKGAGPRGRKEGGPDAPKSGGQRIGKSRPKGRGTGARPGGARRGKPRGG